MTEDNKTASVSNSDVERLVMYVIIFTGTQGKQTYRKGDRKWY